jgi:signal transduction histidine kinase
MEYLYQDSSVPMDSNLLSYLKAAFEQHPAHITILNSFGTICMVNQDWYLADDECLIPSQAAVGANYFHMCEQTGTAGQYIAEQLKQLIWQQIPYFEYEYGTQQGNHYAITASASLTVDDVYLVVVHRDVEGRTDAMRALEDQAERMADLIREQQVLKESREWNQVRLLMLNELLMQFRTPLMTLSTFTYLAAQAPDHKVGYFTDVIHDEIERMSTMVNDMLEALIVTDD